MYFEPGDAWPDRVVWVDLLSPTPEEDVAVEHHLQVNIPTLEDMQEIESSSRLYRENGTIYMTANIPVGSQNMLAFAEPVTFVLTQKTLLTLRYAAPQSFAVFAENAQRGFDGPLRCERVLLGLLDNVIDRIADSLERMAGDINTLSARVMHVMPAQTPHAPPEKLNFHHALQQIARLGDLNSKLRESLVSLGRLESYWENSMAAQTQLDADFRSDLTALAHDIRMLQDHASFLSGKLSFILDATLGMVNIEQNSIIKFFSVAAVVFMPPTLIASVYGMNFQHMPELSSPFAYPAALLAMVVSAIFPYVYFKKKGWF